MLEQLEVRGGVCQRQQLERRQPNLRSLIYALYMSRRKTHRRDAHTATYYSDHYGPYIFSAALVLMLLCIVDAYFTLMLLQYGSSELNPILDWALNKHVLLFFSLKYTVTAGCVVLTVMHKHFRIFGLKGYQILLGYLVGYGILIHYQLSMLMNVLF